MKLPYVQEIPTYRGGTQIQTANAEMESRIACLASEIASRFALVAAMPDGEDSAGRQKLRLPTADELAVRACEIADALWDQYTARGWLVDLPAPVLPDEK